MKETTTETCITLPRRAAVAAKIQSLVCVPQANIISQEVAARGMEKLLIELIGEFTGVAHTSLVPDGQNEICRSRYPLHPELSEHMTQALEKIIHRISELGASSFHLEVTPCPGVAALLLYAVAGPASASSHRPLHGD